MSNHETDTVPSNKKFWIFFAAGISLLILLVIAGITVVNNSSSEPDAAPTPATDQLNNGITETPPKISSVVASSEEDSLVFAVTTETYDSTKWYLEYELADQDRTVKEKDYARSNEFTVKTSLVDSAYYRIKVRLSDKDKTSSWSESYTVEIKDVEGVQKLQPNESYYATPWAQGVGSEDNLIQAIETAYNAKQIFYDSPDVNYCIPLNTGTMTPTLLLPPSPAISPKSVILSFMVNSWTESNKEASISYFWCS
jgi:hypothetical protein